MDCIIFWCEPQLDYINRPGIPWGAELKVSNGKKKKCIPLFLFLSHIKGISWLAPSHKDQRPLIQSTIPSSNSDQIFTFNCPLLGEPPSLHGSSHLHLSHGLTHVFSCPCGSSVWALSSCRIMLCHVLSEWGWTNCESDFSELYCLAHKTDYNRTYVR